MLTPEYLEDLPEEILQLFYAAEQEILADMARRVSTYDYWIPAAEYQRQKLREAGVLQEDILKSLSGITGRSEAELKRLMQEAGTKALRSDTAVYEAAGMTVPKIADSAPLRAILNAGYKATAQTMRNICKTTARTATMQFENALDLAWLKVQSGAFDTDSAVRSAIKELSERGIQSIRYPSGRTDSIEVAVRRAVVTGVNQTTGQLQEELADELCCDLVEVSAHAGARPEHAKWQGKIYSRSGNDPKYPDFKKSTGYGTGAGLCGWNCRHTFGPYIEGSPPVWSEEQLAELDAPKYEYGGKKLTEYEASQQQRYNERQIRRWKREEAAMQAAGLDSSEASAKVKEWQGRQQEFLAQTSFKRQYGREQISIASSWNRGIISIDNSASIDLQSDFGKLVDSQKKVGKEYARAIKSSFNNGTANAKKAFLKLVRPDSVASTTSQSSYFDRAARKVYLNASRDLDERIGIGAHFFHEHGHYIDFFAAGANNGNFISMQNARFGEKLRSDYAAYLKKIMNSKGVTQLRAEGILETELKDKKKYGISDIIDGLTSGKVFGCASHSVSDPDYWKDPGRIEREAFANMFQSCFAPKSAKYMAEYFPEAYKEFKKMLKGLI